MPAATSDRHTAPERPAQETARVAKPGGGRSRAVGSCGDELGNRGPGSRANRRMADDRSPITEAEPETPDRESAIRAGGSAVAGGRLAPGQGGLGGGQPGDRHAERGARDVVHADLV